MDHLLGQDEAACEASGLSDAGRARAGEVATTGKYLVHQKTLDASGVVDDGEVLKVDVSKLPPVLGTAKVTIKYRPARPQNGPFPAGRARAVR